MNGLHALTVVGLLIFQASHAFTLPPTLIPSSSRQTLTSITVSPSSSSSSPTHDAATNTNTITSVSPIFDFSLPQTIESFERIDDVIMGGISTSSMRTCLPAQPYASWSGVCRLDGGGFCGTRTLPFQEPLQLSNADGFYIECRLNSDDEPDRRVWKLSTRTEPTRGEELYQAEFQIPKGPQFSRICLPFSKFQKVRGARYVEGAAPMNVSSGIYQIGMTMSKFVMAQNMTALENFRPGYFELQLQSIGLYYNNRDDDSPQMAIPQTPTTLTPEEVQKNRPLFLKVLLVVAKLFFSETANRRRSAMKLLREQRNMTRPRAILHGIRLRSHKRGGYVRSTTEAASIVLVDAFRTIMGATIKYGLFQPLRVLSKLKRRRQQNKAVPQTQA